MEQKELNDVLFAADYTLKFYGKPMEKIHKQVWSRTVLDSGYSSFQWKEVLREWPSIGKFAPKPSEILEQLALKSENKPRRFDSKKEELEPCPEPIAKAWRYWIPVFWGQSLPFESEDVDEAEAEAYLLLVNEEAKRTNTPEAIPDNYKIEQIWNAG